MDDLRSADVDFLTIGQYLQPTRKHAAVDRFVEPSEFESYKSIAYAKGFLLVASSPLTRSSYHAGDDFRKLQAARRELAAEALTAPPRAAKYHDALEINRVRAKLGIVTPGREVTRYFSASGR